MNLYNLLEKNSRLQVSILQALLKESHSLRISEMMADLSLTRFLFDNNVCELQEVLKTLDLPLALKLDRKKDRIFLEKAENADLSLLYYYYLEHSVEYQILNYLFQHPNNSVIKLGKQLLISEAAVYRHIARLNQYLQEFDLKIQQGKLVGDGLQICHFYYQLFWTGQPQQVILEKTQDPSIQRFIDYLGRKLGTPFTQTNVLKLRLLIQIIKTCATKQDEQTKILEKFSNGQQLDPLYLTIKNAIFQATSHMALFVSDYQAIYLYLFMSSSFLLPPTMKLTEESNYWRTYNPDVVPLNDLVVTLVKEEYQINQADVSKDFIDEWKYYLTQLNSYLYYFKGNITYFDESDILATMTATTLGQPNEVLGQQILDATEKMIGRPLSQDTRRMALRYHLFFIDQMRQFSRFSIKVGVLCNSGYLNERVMIASIQNALAQKYFITCEVAQLGSTYPILVTDSAYEARHYSYQDLHVTHTLMTKRDLAELDQLMKKHSHTKKE